MSSNVIELFGAPRWRVLVAHHNGEVRRSATLTDHLLLLGTAGFIDDAPRSDVASIVAAVLEARAAQILAEKPSVA